jgi:uncharacterized membrane protein YfcA
MMGYAMPHVTLTNFLLSAMLAVFFTAAFQATTGFGMALIGVPALTLLIDPRSAVECITFVSITSTATIAYSYRSHWDLQRAAWLGVPLLAATPVGVYLLNLLSDAQMRIGVAALLLLTSGMFVVNLLIRKYVGVGGTAPSERVAERSVGKRDYSRSACLLVGGTSGVMGGATGMTGPLLANYLIRTGISRESFKVTLNLIFTASALWRASLYVGSGMITRETYIATLLLTPVALLGTQAGMRLDKRIPAEHFITVVHFFLLLLGGWLLFSGCAAMNSGPHR